MGGRILVESEPGTGSTFTVELASAEDPTSRAERVNSSAALTPETANGEATHTVLYIEDNVPNLELIDQILARRPGIKLLAAMQGRLGIELASKHRPDLILLDLHLPDIPGNEVLRLLREDRRTREIPVVVISADATRGQVERLLEAGARAYLTKPLDVPHFLTLVSDILREHEATS
jgi:CheY-like chemotaxis protein